MSDKPLLPPDADVIYKMHATFGHIALRTWLGWRDGQVVGMGEAIHFDADGAVVKRVPFETGVSAVLA